MPELTERANLYVWLVVREKTRENQRKRNRFTHAHCERKQKQTNNNYGDIIVCDFFPRFLLFGE